MTSEKDSSQPKSGTHRSQPVGTYCYLSPALEKGSTDESKRKKNWPSATWKILLKVLVVSNKNAPSYTFCDNFNTRIIMSSVTIE